MIVVPETKLGDFHAQFAALCVLDLLSNLFMESPKQSFHPAQIVDLIGRIRTSPELFSPEALAVNDAVDEEAASGKTEETGS